MGRYTQIFEYEPNEDGKGLKIGIVMSRFNIDICEGLLSACNTSLLRQGVVLEDIRIATVSGALEIPLTLKKMAESGKYDALIALGSVVRGDTYHFEVVSNESASGIMRVGLDTGIPIANAILTTDSEHQATARMSEKGAEAARVAIEMVRLLRAL
ncbi:MAG: 6,7-dimethyl-8-ribityllumazine synthase [Hydrogenophilales bacterium CG17_big_fil_post_rev_8_21_14_2_50_63_12]|nr:MAG: 6,7-dimethyl-8-ribityllumazine synthase [Hydrogenophilales bacterium CG17_big_fil_post_rev_8_21_14_2_50_63_12]PIX97837.1 MAG: 6,7-dimethyl-8-ribityllumazine synthase [Hydrogenophilales bacterium CG_4_10_14_3_um_filter_63_21]PJB05080.1 MAG: 6,7-dimethyl-8-ribityllumazine synthase [Hydrogenophilales bacterium CG_4_9_14_3_um_filter_63_34]